MDIDDVKNTEELDSVFRVVYEILPQLNNDEYRVEKDLMMLVKQDRLERERHTIQAMIEIYCRGHHHLTGTVCAECQQLWAYARQRLDKCPYQDDKPTCAKCPTHCYKPIMREQIRQVMRYAGPRMMLYHPLLAILHYIDEMTKADKSKADVKGTR